MATTVNVGDKVTTNAETYWGSQMKVPTWVKNSTLYVRQVGIDGHTMERIVVSTVPTGPVTGAVHIDSLTVVQSAGTPEKPPTTTPTPDVPSETETTENYLRILDRIRLEKDIFGRPLDKYKVNDNSDGDYIVQDLNNRETSYIDPSDEVIEKVKDIQTRRVHDDNVALQDIRVQHPRLIQNSACFPRCIGVDEDTGIYKYDYYMDYDSSEMPIMFYGTTGLGNKHRILTENSHRSVNIDVENRRELTRLYTQAYNKYKVPNPNDQLAKTFSHVFFVRPDCNIYASNSSASSEAPELTPSLSNLSEFFYANKHSPDILRQLTQSGSNYEHEFALFLSNKARSMQISDEYIVTDTYGDALTGYKVAYGKHNVESRTANKFTVHYIDDRDLNVYNLHKLWIDYISYVYRGKVWPKMEYIMNKVLDYPTCVYYIVCAEDGETIIFWSKYWGVFPTNAPSSAYSWNADNPGGITKPEIDIDYQFSWKEDFNPLSLVEFNQHGKVGNNGNFTYVPSYQSQVGGTGYTFTGTPFVETYKGNRDVPYTFKLRFRKFDGLK